VSAVNATETARWPFGPTEEEELLLRLVARGLSDYQIARQIRSNPFTAKHRVERLRAKIGACNRTELAAWAGRNGYYEVPAL
jgi:DNA-binding NarL/FixJ family response regulator